MNTPLKKAAAHACGMTLVESVVVIFVMITVIVVVFMGARAWKKDSDKAACINNLQKVQLLVRSHQNLHRLAVLTPINIRTELIGQGRAMKSEPLCPTSGYYEYSNMIPAVGSLAITCKSPEKNEHYPQNQSDW